MTCITTTKKTTNVLIAKETLPLVLEIVKYGRKITKLKHTQNITYPEKRRMVDYKICGSDKKISRQPKNKTVMCVKPAQPQNPGWFVNKMRALIQKMKTVIEAVTEKLSTDPNTRVALTSKVTSATKDPTPKKTKGTPSTLPERQEHWYKTGKKNRSNSRTKTTPKKGQIWAHGNRGFHLPKKENTDEHQNWNTKTRKHIHNALRNSHQYESNTAMHRDQQTPMKNLLWRQIL